MEWVTIIVIILVAVVVLELFKHIFLRNFSKWLIILIIVLIILFVLASFLDITPLKNSENKMISTGAAIFSDINDDISGNLKQSNISIPFSRKTYK